MAALKTIPRLAVNGYLRTLRLPLKAAERVAGQRENESWPPALLFESLEAKVEGAVGALLRDDELLDAAQLREAKVAKLREAQTLKAASDLERERAREEEREREAQIARQRQQAEQAAQQRKQAAKAEAEAKKRQASEEAAKKANAARAQEAAQQKAIERRERATKREALRAESDALDLTDEALQAQETVDLIDKTIEGNKEARKTG
jgi:hypothetical protein